MDLPFFFVEQLNKSVILMDENTSKHMINVLRLQKGEEVLLTDGKGKKANGFITDTNRKKCVVEISGLETKEKKNSQVGVAISLIKNTSRFEWFLEKATEIGIDEIIPLICARTEKEKFRYDRMHNILVSAMLQSQQYWLPILHETTEFEKAVQLPYENKFIAHCNNSNKLSLSSMHGNHSQSQLILIGPEGDFTNEEIEFALKNSFAAVSLGNTRLRTETAAIVAAALLCIH